MIHRGGPYGGHYHAYIRDDLEDGNWDVELPEHFQAEPTEVTKDDPAKKEEFKQEEAKQEEPVEQKIEEKK